MGGHSAWRKRVEKGGLAKGSGGAILRHRPRLGRKGKEQLALNRKGNLGGHGNPKKKSEKKKRQAANKVPTGDTINDTEESLFTSRRMPNAGLLFSFLLVAGVGVSWLLLHATGNKPESRRDEDLH